MKQLQLAIGLLIFLCLVASCKSQKQGTQPDSNLKISIQKALGDNYQEEFNSDSTYLLCSTQTDAGHPIVTKFVIGEVETDEIIYQSSVKDGFVKWKDNKSLLIKDQPGIESTDKSDHLFVIDLATKRKTTYNPKNNE